MTSEPTGVAVVGTGLIGCSIALAAARAGDDVTGFDPDPGTLRAAADRSGLRAAVSLEGCARSAEVIFVCAPIEAIPGAAAGCLASGPGIVTDVGSVKTKVLVEVEGAVSSTERSRFVGGHPMGGAERRGPEGA